MYVSLVGAQEGCDKVGSLEGGNDGLEDGDKVGSLEGGNDGLEDGDKVGSLEGGNDGLEDGDKVGSLEGGNDGLEDGDKVGSLEGGNVGRRKGSPEGCQVGSTEWWKVGSDDADRDDGTIEEIIEGDVESRGDAVGRTSLSAFVAVDDRIGAVFKIVTREREPTMTITTDSAASARDRLFCCSLKKPITDFLWRS
jgi:hypothetical protein